MKFIFRRALFALVVAATSIGSSHVFARSKRYIVRVADPQALGGRALMAARQDSLTYLASEIDQNMPGSSTLYQADKFGMLIVQDDESGEDLSEALKRHPYVKYFEEEIEFRTAAAPSSNNPSGFSMAPWLRDVLSLNASAPDASIGYAGSTPTIVAVIDTGAMINHPYLESAILENSAEKNGIAGVDDDNNGVIDDIYGANMSPNSSGVLLRNGNVSDIGTDHGSHVAGLVKSVRDQAYAYRDGGSAPYQVAASVKILPIRFINESQVGTTSGAIAAIDYAARRGAKVINCSWGARGEESFSQALYDAMAQAYRQDDIVIVVAAGNAERFGPNNNDLTPYFPSSFAIPGLLSVASVSPEYTSGGPIGGTLFRLELSEFSNYGARAVHIAAPGGYRDITGDSAGVFSVNARAAAAGGTGAEYVRKKGTSMAAPVVAGVAGVVRAINPQLTAYEVTQLILNTAARKSNLVNAVSSSAIVDAVAAFRQADIQVSANLRPEPPRSPYNKYSTSDTSSSGRKRGGCGAIDPMSSDSMPGDGPFGGNSLLLFTALYLFANFIQSLRRHMKQPRV